MIITHLGLVKLGQDLPSLNRSLGQDMPSLKPSLGQDLPSLYPSLDRQKNVKNGRENVKNSKKKTWKIAEKNVKNE